MSQIGTFIKCYFRVNAIWLLRIAFSLSLKMEARVVVLQADHQFRTKSSMSRVNKKPRSGRQKTANLNVLYSRVDNAT